MKIGTDDSSFVLKPKFEWDILEIHVTDDVTLFCQKIFFQKLMQIIYHSIQN